MKNKPVVIICGDPESTFNEILIKTLKSKVLRNFKFPIIIICSEKLFQNELRKLKTKINLQKFENQNKLLNNKIYIIQSLDKALNIDDIAKGKGLTREELLSEMEEIVEKGTKLNLRHIINEMMDRDELDEIHAFFKSTENFSFDEARLEFTEDEFTDDEIRLLRIDFISQVAN